MLPEHISPTLGVICTNLKYTSKFLLSREREKVVERRNFECFCLLVPEETEEKG
jgi:hypothetical protein